ncbi:MAG: 16S rRNA (cytosine(967)-C(5))-methyltransferase RsmB [Clostridia bacterium]|nr:16S rRNA (cytosine(967)-C(5))-methyltransferase RsmB [Clostridia bacterium]
MADARQVAFTQLCKIERDNAYSNLILSEKGDNTLSDKDRVLSHRIVKTVLERKITVDYNLSKYLTQPLKKLKPQVLTILRMGACQILFMDKIPVSAAINESVKLTKKNGCAFASGLVNAVLRKVSVNGLVLPDEKDEKYLGVKYSFPDYLVRKLCDYYGREIAEKIMEASLDSSKIYIRKNTLKNEELSVETEVTDFENCYSVKNTGDITALPDFRNGLFHVQDLSSQICCKVLDAKKGETVIDICSAPGGKSMTIAEMMENEGRVISCDIYEHKLRLISDTAKRLGIDIIETKLRDGTDETNILPEADRILCDVPCSGFGVTGKKPEIRYKDEKEVASLPELGLEILEKSSRYLKKGGRLVYSTCTLLPEENIDVCKAFLANNKDFVSVCIDDSIKGFRDGETLTVLPHIYDCDGFFVAAFEKK